MPHTCSDGLSRCSKVGSACRSVILEKSSTTESTLAASHLPDAADRCVHTHVQANARTRAYTLAYAHAPHSPMHVCAHTQAHARTHAHVRSHRHRIGALERRLPKQLQDPRDVMRAKRLSLRDDPKQREALKVREAHLRGSDGAADHRRSLARLR